MNILIRKAENKDTETLDKLLTKLIQDERQYDKNINENFEVKNFYENYINNENICALVAIIDNVVVGYIYGFIDNVDDLTTNKTSKLDALYVEENMRGKGIATSLIQEFKKWSKDKNAVKIEVNVCAENIKAKEVYMQQGFSKLLKETLVLEL